MHNVRHSRRTGMRRPRAVVAAIWVGLAALVNCAAPQRESPTTLVKPSMFTGRLGFLATTGSFVPITDAELHVGFGKYGCQPSLQEKKAVQFDSQGTFEIPLVVRVGETRWREFSASADSPMQADESVQTPCYRFTATKCQDLTIRSLDELESNRLEMLCPGRQDRHPEA